jgi:hypothetical protein
MTTFNPREAAMTTRTHSDKPKAQGAKTATAKTSPFKDPKVEKFIINLQKAFGTYDAKKHQALIGFLKAKA